MRTAHVNNIDFVRWMQDAAVAHSDAVGGSAATRRPQRHLGTVRKHEIEYRGQAFVGDQIEVRTWIHDCRHVSSPPQIRVPTAPVTIPPSFARGTTDWVLLDAKTFAPFCLSPKIFRNSICPGTLGAA